MNSSLNIYVRVINQARGQLNQVQRQVQGVDRSLASAGRQAGVFNARLATQNLTRYGKNLQWVGQQIAYNFTLPLVLAGAAAVKWSNMNEKAFTRMVKVYGDGSQSSKQIQTETNALRRAFVQLSNVMGISQDQILDIGADWAAAGVSGASLAKYTRLTAEAMILGEMNAEETTRALVSISAQYKLNADQLKDTIGILNAVENQTGTSFAGLIQGFQRAAGFARVAGVDARHLAAQIAAISPAAGSAAQAGNALKSIYASLLAPTAKSASLFREMGINIEDSAWQSQNANDRLITLAKSMQGLTQNQKAQIDATVAGKWQISRFSVLLDALVDKQSYYWKALEATSSKTKILGIYSNELRKVLESQPKQFDILKVRIQNAMTQAIIPLIPAILSLIATISHMADAFAALDPSTQKLILFALVLLAVVGPLIRYLGATIVLLGVLGGALLRTAGFLLGFGVSAATGAARVGLLGRAIIVVSGVATTAFGLMTAAASFFWGMLLRAPIMLFVSSTASAFLFLARTVVGVLAGVLSTLVGVFGPALAAGWAAIMRGISVITLAWSAAMRAIMVTFSTSMGIIMAATGGIAVIWRTILIEIQLLTVAWSNIMKWLFIQLGAGLKLIQVGMGTMLIALNGRLMRALTLIWSAGARAIMLVWSVLQFGLIRVMNWGVLIATASRGIILLGRTMITGFAMLSRAVAPIILGIFTNPWALGIIAAVALIVRFRAQIAEVFRSMINSVLRMFHALPQGIQNAFISVIRVISSAVKSVRSWLGEMSPFKRHSPSLVDNVRSGTKVIGSHYKKMSRSTQSHVGEATGSLNNFENATKGARAAAAQQEQTTQRATVVAAAPAAGPSYDATVSSMNRLEATLPAAEAAINKQKAAVERWKDALDRADNSLDSAQKQLDKLQKNADKASDALSASKDRLDGFANAPIAGMKAMDEQIWRNNQATNKLQLQLLKLADAGQGPEDLSQKFQNLQGDIETLTGMQRDLRSAGAGSEITGPIQDQIDAMEKQAQAVKESAKGANALQDQLDALQRKGQILDLEKAVQFDPLTHQIEQLTDATKELSFDDIIAGIKTTQVEVAKNQGAFDAATAAVERQQAAVDLLKERRDAISDVYDAENAKLDKMNDAYQANVDLINKMKDALKDFASQAEAASDAAKGVNDSLGGGAGGGSDALDSFAAAGAGDYEVPGEDTFKLGSDVGDQTSNIDALAKDWENEAKKAFSGISLLEPFRNMFSKALNWVNEHTGGLFGKVMDQIGKNLGWLLAGAVIGGMLLGPWGALGGALIGLILSKVDFKAITSAISGFFNDSSIGKGIVTAFTGIADGISSVFGTIWGVIQRVWALLEPIFYKIGDAIWKSLVKAFDALKNAFARIAPLVGPVVELLGNLWAIVKPVAAIVGGALLLALKVIGTVFAEVIGPAIGLVIDGFTMFFNVATDIIGFIVNLLNGDFSEAFKYIGKLVGDIFNGMVRVVKGVWDVLYGIVSGIVKGIVGFFQWAYDVLLGHSIIPDIVNGIIAAFTTLYDVAKAIWEALGAALQWVWDNVLMPIWDLFKWAFDNILKPVFEATRKVFQTEWNIIRDVLKAIWNQVISPIWAAMKWAVENVLAPTFRATKRVFTEVWNGISAVMSTVWNKGIAPIWSAMVWSWNNVLKPMLQGMKDFFYTVWTGIGAVVDFAWNKVISPAYEKLKSGWESGLKPMLNTLIRGFVQIFNGVGEGVALGINVAVSALNALIAGINWVLDKIPGLGGHINEIGKASFSHWSPPQLAAGGNIPKQHVNAGFKTNGARAIVGEGNPMYPEYVIPTDPKYRDRASKLYDEVGDVMSQGRAKGERSNGQFLFADGGLLGQTATLGGLADSVISGLKKGAGYIRKGAVTAALAPFLKAFDSLNSLTPDDLMGLNAREMLNQKKNEFYNWAKGDPSVNRDFGPNWEDKPPDGGTWEHWTTDQIVGGLGGGAWEKIIEYARRGPAFTTAFPGLDRGGKSYHESGNAVDFSGGDMMAMAEYWMQHYGALKELIHSPGMYVKDGVRIGSYGAATDAAHFDHVHVAATAESMNRLLSRNTAAGLAAGGLIPSMANGGIVGPRPGGTLVRVGEAGQHEAITPLPNNWKKNKGGDTFEFHGDLSFPNITDGGDAEEFIANLKSLAN